MLTSQALRHTARQGLSRCSRSGVLGSTYIKAAAAAASSLSSPSPFPTLHQSTNHKNSTSLQNKRFFTSTPYSKMPQTLNKSDIQAENDPSVSKQYDRETPLDEQIEDFYGIADKISIGLLTSHREPSGLISRSMAIAKREGPDFYFLCNKHSKKYSQMKSNPEVELGFNDPTTKNWISISGTATLSNDDPKIKDLYSKPVSAWFGDLGDGVHTGGPEDPRMTMIHVKPNYIIYYKTTVGALGYMKEIAQSTIMGSVADTGVIREFNESEISTMRSKA